MSVSGGFSQPADTSSAAVLLILAQVITPAVSKRSANQLQRSSALTSNPFHGKAICFHNPLPPHPHMLSHDDANARIPSRALTHALAHRSRSSSTHQALRLDGLVRNIRTSCKSPRARSSRRCSHPCAAASHPTVPHRRPTAALAHSAHHPQDPLCSEPHLIPGICRGSSQDDWP